MRIGASRGFLRVVARYNAAGQSQQLRLARNALFSVSKSVHNSAEAEETQRSKIEPMRSTRPSDSHFVNKLPNMLAINADVSERNKLIEAKRASDFDKIIDVYINSANPGDFDSAALTAALEACEYSQNPACLQIIPEIYNALAARETRTRHTILLALRVIERHTDKGKHALVPFARTIVEDYNQLFAPTPESDAADVAIEVSHRRVTSSYIRILCQSRLVDAAMAEMFRAWNSKMVLFPDACESLIRLLSARNDVRELNHVLTYMAENDITPSAKNIDQLANVGLATSDRWVLRRVMHHTRAKGRQLDYGTLSKILNCAARTADAQLAMEVIAAMEAAKYELSYMDLRATIIATSRAQDDAAAVSAFMEMEQRGMKADWSLVVQFGCGLAKHMRRMDETYYALADAAKVEKIPSAALEGVMIGSGKAGSLDRAFATFQDAKQVFGLQPNLSMYNALLYTASMIKYRKVPVVASVMQQMEEENISPDAISYQFILKSLLDARQFDKAEAIFNHMLSKGVTPTSSTLRVYARALMSAGRSKQAEVALEQLVLLEGAVPKYLSERLAQISSSTAAQKDSNNGTQQQQPKA